MHYKLLQVFFKLLVLNFFYCQATALPVDIQKSVKAEKFYQITTFISENIEKISGVQVFLETPNKIYSYDKNNQQQQQLYDSSSVSSLEMIYSLQESLVIFHTNNLNETKSFIDYLIPQLSIRQRPKLLTVCLKNSVLEDEIDTINILKYAWKKNFLDFSIIITNTKGENATKLFTTAYHYSPFNGTIVKRKLHKGIDLFPDKLRNAYGYPLNIATINIPYKTTHIQRPYRKVKIFPRDLFNINFTARVLNLTTVLKKNENVSKPIFNDYLKKNNLDMTARWMFNRNYLTYFLIPAVDQRSIEWLAFVPIFSASRMDIFVKLLCNVLIIFGFIFSFLYLLHRFQTAAGGSIIIFDYVKLILAQSIGQEPRKAVLRIIMTTVIAASVIIMNDILSDLISIQFGKREMPFDTYEDLYNSQLQTITADPYLQHLENIDDEYLQKIINRTLYESNPELCVFTLRDWKNVSCIYSPFDVEGEISDYPNPDGSPAMKVAQPPIDVRESCFFYWFADASPYAAKFHKTMQRVKETSLMHLPALTEKNSSIILYPNNINVTVVFDDQDNTEQLLTVSCFGVLTSVIVFVIELIMTASGNKK